MKRSKEEIEMKVFLLKLVAALHELDPMGNVPNVLGEEQNFERDTLCWDGPFEWCCSLVGGCSIYAGETGSYGSTSLEESLATIIEELEAKGYYLEPVDSSSQVCIYEA